MEVSMENKIFNSFYIFFVLFDIALFAEGEGVVKKSALRSVERCGGHGTPRNGLTDHYASRSYLISYERS